MRILVDTHVLVWLLYEPQKIRPTAREKLQTATIAYISMVSFWELAIKFGNKRFPYPPEKLINSATKSGLIKLPIRTGHIIRLPSIELSHHDPFDKLLIAQAQAESCSLLTADSLLLQSSYRTLEAQL